MDRRWLKVAVLAVSLFSAPLRAEIGATLGYFNIKSTTSAGDTNLANLGHFRLVYEIPFMNRFSVKPSYSLYLLGIDSSDIGYGFDLEFNYYPFTFNRPMKLGQNSLNFMSAEKLRPFVGLSFHQRQYQSIQSNYAGIGITFGAQYQYSREFRFVSGLTVISMKGPLDSALSEQQLYFGTIIEL
ncbi:hypothetical protein [Pseudobacteriovorax antillogorgiicola]|nr:hypothetical protein [Pseudobacteriovorax antillogorgiicola]